jgi:hypothetical protein
MKVVHLCIVLISALMLFGACNVFDWLYSDDGADTFEKALANAEAAMKRDNYKSAVQLYERALKMRTNSSEAMIGLASATLMSRVNVSDIPKLVTAIFNINVSGEPGSDDPFAEDFLVMEQDYRETMVDALNLAAFIRAPVNAIDPETGVIRTNDVTGLPELPSPDASDGVIAVTDSNSILNYIILKTAEVSLWVQDSFEVTKNLEARLKVADAEMGDELQELTDEVVAYIAASTLDPSVLNTDKELEFQEDFEDFRSSFADFIAEMDEVYEEFKETLTGTGKNTSLPNLIDVAEALVAVVKNTPGMSPSIVENVEQAVTEISYGLNNLQKSFTDPNKDGSVLKGINDLKKTLLDIETAAKGTVLPALTADKGSTVYLMP